MREKGAGSDTTFGTDTSATHAAGAGDAPRPPGDLLRRARGGDTGAFTELVSSIQVPLCSYLARLVGNTELGRDLTQETLIRAWTNLPELHEADHFKGWLYRIGTNLARSHLRRARRLQWFSWIQMEDGTSSQVPSTPGPEAGVSEADELEATLARLSPQYRTCLLLQVIGGFSQRDIARLLGISEKSVSSNVSRAREQFRRIYTKGDLA
jgi:RNA polymerase sigma-70 factor, ECF subfamily